jgi:hypothetical protein
MDEARLLVEDVRAAARRHNITWEKMVPDAVTLNLAAEAAEEAAYSDMAAAKARLRDHICATYGLTIRELASLALP